MGVLSKLQKNTTITESDILSDSKFFTEQDMITTDIPAINIALSGSIMGGLTPGLTVFAGPSKHFKTSFVLMMAKAYLDKYPEAALLFYDSEFGTPQSYFETFGIDTKRVLHTPITDVEQLKHDVMRQLHELDRSDKVIIVVDSIGNLASKKEVEDTLNEKSVADMSRAKQIKSLFRMVTPHLKMKDIPLCVVNHTYMEQGLFPKAVVSGGTGIYYSADNIFIVGRRSEKEGTEVVGYNFIINVEKSRFVKEKSKIPIEVTWEGGLSKWSGLIDIACELNAVAKPSKGWYARVDLDTGEVEEQKFRLKDTYTKEFWLPVLTHPEFNELVKGRYQVARSSIFNDDEEESHE